ncbi:hypothetical protein ACHAWO_009685 [Cyclotella atomus]|uniref:SAP domain-containing protein n=1 Tax=Cyclotella atomus TaxID=382360 RepID=A0ABD3NPF9_9STRA
MSSLAEKLRAAAAAEKLRSEAAISGDQKNDDGQKTSADSNENPNSDSENMASHPNADSDNVQRPRISLASKLSSSGSNVRPRAATKLLAAVAVAKFVGDVNIPWGSYSFLEKLDIATLSNEKLRRHLSARGESTDGAKMELIDRLADSLEEERKRELAIKLELEAKHRQIADLEEQGAVYSCGKNNVGQLGLGDLDDRRVFTAIPFTRGRQCQHVSTSPGSNMTLATTENHEVFCWGGGGMGPMGIKGKYKSGFDSPQLITKLNGEDIVMTSIGANHAVAMSEGGDLFSWGKGDFGVLGSGELKKTDTPKFMDGFNLTVASISCGEQHTCIKTSQGGVYTWGHAANGRLGVGDLDTTFQPSPLRVQIPQSHVVKKVACGLEHTLVSTQLTVFSFGSGDGGRLGHGPDHSDRVVPTEIVSMRGSHILDISAGTWHSGIVVNVPPMKGAGYLCTFGSGYKGQLGLETCQTSTPTLVTALCNGQVHVRSVFCGHSHNAAIASDGILWTWGSNKHGALGRSVEEEFTPQPGVVAEFGTIVDRIGRGLPRSVALGREYTIVATSPYDGPTEEEALRVLEMHRQRDEAERKHREAVRLAKEEELMRLRKEEMERKKIRYLTSKRLCTMDPRCPGFTYESNQPSVCRECGFSVVYHTIVVDQDDDDEENVHRE